MRENQIDFNSLFILECFYFNNLELLNQFKIPSFQDFQLSQCLQKLKKEEYIVEDPKDNSIFIISQKGIGLYEYIAENIVENMTTSIVMMNIPKLSDDDKFKEWWDLYPKSPAWTSDDQKTSFTGSRVLKNLRKPIAKIKYLKLLNQGLKHQELIDALHYEIKEKKIDSVKKNINQMEFFKGMESYFNSERYLTYIDSCRENPKFLEGGKAIVGKKQNVKDI